MPNGACNNPCDLKYLDKISKKKNNYLAFETEEKITWCGGCGNYGVQNALKRALTLEGLGVRDFMLFFDIGCNGNGSDKFNAFTFHGLHGRVIPAAVGGALANHKVKVIASAGDGATLSEGVNHLVHAVRNDYPMVFLLHNNQNYGLTTGQASATTRAGIPMNASPDGVVAEPMNPSEFVLALRPTFVARTFTGDVKHMTEIMREALNHRGFAFIEIMQSCPTYNRQTPKRWYWDRMKYLSDLDFYDCGDLEMAKKYAGTSASIEEEIWAGILYRDESTPHFLERLISRQGLETTLIEEVSHYNVGNLLKRFE